MFDLALLQAEHKPWADNNFGPRAPWQPLMGMVEELGELEEAIHYDASISEIKDAVGDTVIFMTDFCTGLGFNLDEIVKDFLINCKYIQGMTFGIAVGRIAHSFLKMSQNIRGTKEQHEERIKLAVGQLYFCLSDTVNYHCNEHMLDIVKETWDVVKLRNWSKNKVTGA